MISDFGFFGNIFFRMMAFERKGEKHPGHAHNFDHVTFLTNGSMHIRWENPKTGETGEKAFTAPTPVTIKAGVRHEITALEDRTVAWCVFAHRDLDGQQTDSYDGRLSPYE